MNELLAQFRSAVVSTLLFVLLCCGVYPLLVYVVARAAFPAQAGGSLVTDANGVIRGSRLIGQAFTGGRYFQPRPSAAGSGYDAANSGGSNLGPTSQKLRDQLRDRIAAYRATNGLAADVAIPADAVSASGSGLDPHISPANARLQASRVACARALPPEVVLAEVARHTQGPDLGVLGEPLVNVLALNLALDAAASRPGSK